MHCWDAAQGDRDSSSRAHCHPRARTGLSHTNIISFSGSGIRSSFHGGGLDFSTFPLRTHRPGLGSKVFLKLYSVTSRIQTQSLSEQQGQEPAQSQSHLKEGVSSENSSLSPPAPTPATAQSFLSRKMRYKFMLTSCCSPCSQEISWCVHPEPTAPAWGSPASIQLLLQALLPLWGPLPSTRGRM